MPVPRNHKVNRVVGRPLPTQKPTSTHLRPPSSRAERTPEAVAVSGISRERGESLKTLPDFPQTNLPQVATAVLEKPPGTPRKPAGKDGLEYYLEYIATSPSLLCLPALQENRTICGSLCKVGEDEDGNGIAFRTSCRREWCSDCRVIEHRRRIASVLPHLLQLDWMAYEVTTFPLEVRSMMRDPRVLTLLAKRYRKLLRKSGHRKIFTRWHYFGDKSHRFNPHLNALLDGGHLSPEQLEARKDLIRRKLLPRSIAKSIGKDLVIHYDYTRDAKRKMHWIKYVTKATFTDRSWDEELAGALYGFHNGCFAGFWDDPPKWRLTGTDKKFNALLKVKEGIHPISGKPIVWSKPLIPWALVQSENLIDLGSWCYYYSAPRAPPLPPLDLSNLTELPDGDHRKHSNAVRRSIDRARERVSFLSDHESYS